MTAAIGGFNIPLTIAVVVAEDRDDDTVTSQV